MSEIQVQGASGRGAGRTHEPGDMDARLVLLFGIGLAAVVIGIACLVKLVFAGTPPAAASAPSEIDIRSRPEPRLETTSGEDLRQFRRTEDWLLGSYGWVDRDLGVFRIPIDAAMDKVLRRGFPVRPAGPPGE